MWRHFIKDYFLFTRKERAGVISILSIVFFLILVPLAFPFFIKEKQYSYKQFEGEIARLEIETADSAKIKNYSGNINSERYSDAKAGGKKYEAFEAAVFYFDPNTISSEDWKRLGVREKTIATIQNYLSKGGRFRKAQDIGKIWGLPVKDQQRLIPYVSIKNTGEKAPFEKKEYSKSLSYSPKPKQLIDVNLADTSGYISLPGIGSRLSQRIIAFRDKLGGFHSVDQVGETYLLPDSTFQKIRSRLVISDSTVKKININVASVDDMKVHPYLRYALANAIFQYRRQHGSFSSVEGVKKIMLITGDVYSKIAPYLSVQ